MNNFEEEIKRITDEVISDGTITDIIREKVVNGFKGAIEDAFRWGSLKKMIEKRIEEIMVPYIENYDMSEYLVKMDSILTEIVNKSVLVENKTILENFKYLMTPVDRETITIDEIFDEYKKYVAKNMDTSSRDVCDDDPEEYVPMEIQYELIEEDDKSWLSSEYAKVEFSVAEEDQEDELNFTLELRRYKFDKSGKWKIRPCTHIDLSTLSRMDEFEMYISKLHRSEVNIVIDSRGDSDEAYSETKPEYVLR